jgi:adenylosuccinate lyase
MTLESLTAISPLDGRYHSRTGDLPDLVSEFALIRFRVEIMVEWFVYLADQPAIEDAEELQASTQAECRDVWRNFGMDDARAVQAIESEINHDVKAVEYFVKNKFRDLGLDESVEFVHFACTSEDVNNLAYGLMLKRVREKCLVPAVNDVLHAMAILAQEYAQIPMLSRTHGQPASPTTVGKELANFAARIEMCLCNLEDCPIYGKINGAVGNYNAHVVAYPDIDWPVLSENFVSSLGLTFNPMTTQIEPHDHMARFFQHLQALNQVMLDFNRDIWSYISLGYFKQRAADNEVGSSTMPHKVNPIDFENAEGQIGLADALLNHLAGKLTVSRWQRDLSDSTALRSVGTAFGHCMVAYSSSLRGIHKLELDLDVITNDLEASWEVLAEAIQTTMRKHGIKEPYERLKQLTRGRHFDETVYHDILSKLDLPQEALTELEALAPATYTGLASSLAIETVSRIMSRNSAKADDD